MFTTEHLPTCMQHPAIREEARAQAAAQAEAQKPQETHPVTA